MSSESSYGEEFRKRLKQYYKDKMNFEGPKGVEDLDKIIQNSKNGKKKGGNLLL